MHNYIDQPAVKLKDFYRNQKDVVMKNLPLVHNVNQQGTSMEW